MITEKTLEQRSGLRNYLGNLVAEADVVEKILKEIPHKNGSVYRSLKPKSGEFIVGTPKGFNSFYRDINGQLYEI